MARRTGVALGLAAVLVGLVVLQQRGLRDLRQLEDVYISSRKVTACTTARLDPYATEEDLRRLDETLDRLIADAITSVVAVRARLDEVRVAPVPRRSMRAREAVVRSVDAQLELYESMAADQPNTRPELEALGRSINRAERALADLRSVLFVGKAHGWDDRFNCPRAIAQAGD